MPDWTVAELLLALETYQRNGRALDDRHPDVQALSDFLTGLRLFPEDARSSSFRNPNGVSAKLQNFARFDQKSTSSRTHGGGLEEPLWEAFHDRPDTLARLCDQIRRRARRGAKAL